jgi:E3 Ubiquitin ligase
VFAEIAVLILMIVTSFAFILPSSETGILALIGIAGGLYLFVQGFRLLVRKRLLLNTPASKIRSASLSLVEVSGVATGPYTLPAPITGAPCFLYRTTAWQKSDDSKNGEWKKVAEESLHVPFFLDDTSGQLLIDPGGADLDLHRDFRQNYNDTFSSQHATPQVLSFLARHGVEFSNKLRIEECSIQSQNPLFIVGTLAENPGIEVRPFAAEGDVKSNQVGVGAQRSLNTPPQEVVRLSEPAQLSNVRDMTQQSKIAAALSKAGVTSPAAWEAAGVPYQSAVAESARIQQISINAGSGPPKPASESRFNLNPPVILMKGGHNPFLISWRSQQDFVRSLAWKSGAMIWGGAALTLLGIYVLLQ